jgi:hypothetical protein
MRKPQQIVEKQYALIRTEKIAREVRQRSLQNAGNAPRPPRDTPGALGEGLLTPGLSLTGGRSYMVKHTESHDAFCLRTLCMQHDTRHTCLFSYIRVRIFL